MEREFTCFFTGHRIIANNEKPEIQKSLEIEIEKLINEKNVTDFIAGGALGFDSMAARTVIRLKEKYDNIKLHLYLPCYDQMKNWRPIDQFTGRIIMSHSDSILYVTEGYYVTGCMQLRNKSMAQDGKYCLAYMKNPRSGTGQTVSYSEEMGNMLINIYKFG